MQTVKWHQQKPGCEGLREVDATILANRPQQKWGSGSVSSCVCVLSWLAFPDWFPIFPFDLTSNFLGICKEICFMLSKISKFSQVGFLQLVRSPEITGLVILGTSDQVGWCGWENTHTHIYIYIYLPVFLSWKMIFFGVFFWRGSLVLWRSLKNASEI